MDLSDSKEIQYDILGLVPQTTDAYHKIKREEFERINEGLFQECIKIVKDCLSDAHMKVTDIHKVILTGGSSRIPKLQQMLKDLFGNKTLSKGVDPDEAVAYGAAVQAAMLTQADVKALVPKIIDITPLSLGTGIFGEVMTFIIKRNSQIPVTKTVTRCTVYDQQTGIDFRIYEGERSLIQHNTKIGSCSIQLNPHPPGYSVELSLHVNENGVLEVGAKTEDGVYTSLTIKYEKQNVQTVTDILRKAKLHEREDSNVKNVIELWKDLLNYCIRVKAVCNYDKQKLTSEEKEMIVKIAKEVQDWLEKNTVEIGNEAEKEAISENQKRVEEICEPILNKYDYNIKRMSLTEFFKFSKGLQED